MGSTSTATATPAHFRPPTRRAFLYVGLVGGLGLSLDQLFRLQAQAGSPRPNVCPSASSPDPNR